MPLSLDEALSVVGMRFLFHPGDVTSDLTGMTLQQEAAADVRTVNEFPYFSTSKVLGLPQSFG